MHVRHETDAVRIVPTASVLEVADPSGQWIWNSRPVDSWPEALRFAEPIGTPVAPDSSSLKHAGRVRWLITHGWTDPIDVEVGGTTWPILDGNHRLVAAALRGDLHVSVRLSGWVDLANQLLKPLDPW